MSQLIDKGGAPVRVLPAVERIQLGSDHVEGIVGKEELCQQGTVISLEQQRLGSMKTKSKSGVKVIFATFSV